MRIVRVGTHALTATSQTTLWNRLSQHKGQKASGGGNHRGSIFRLLVGSTLLLRRAILPDVGPGQQRSPGRPVLEQPLEREVSAIIGAMPFLWLAVDDPGMEACEGISNATASRSSAISAKRHSIRASPAWRGRSCVPCKACVRHSGLWNQNHVDEAYEPGFSICSNASSKEALRHEDRHPVRRAERSGRWQSLQRRTDAPSCSSRSPLSRRLMRSRYTPARTTAPGTARPGANG